MLTLNFVAYLMLASTCGESSTSRPADFDSVGAAIGRLGRAGGTGFLVGGGWLLTAYHNLDTAVAQQRLGTDARRHSETKYDQRRVEPQTDLTVTFSEKKRCDKTREVRIGARVVSLSPHTLPTTDEIPIALDWAVLRVEAPPSPGLRFSEQLPNPGDRVWMVGIPTGISPTTAVSDETVFSTWVAAVTISLHAAVYDALAADRLDGLKAADSAMKALRLYETTVQPEVRNLIEEAAKDSLSDLRAIVDNQEVSQAQLAKYLTIAADAADAAARDRRSLPRASANERARATRLRDLARNSTAEGLGETLLTVRDELQRKATRMFKEASTQFAHLQDWICGSLISTGTIVSVSNSTLTIRGFAQSGMSGGPVLNQQREVVGMLLRIDSRGESPSEDILVAVRSDILEDAIDRLQNPPAGVDTTPTR